MSKARTGLVAAALVIGAAVAAITAASGTATADDGRTRNFLRVNLSGYNEAPNALSVASSGSFVAIIDSRTNTITYTLTYSALTGDVVQAHIHFGAKGQSGANVSAFLCGNGVGPAGTQPCPPGPATVTGTITSAEVIGPNALGIAPGEIAELIAAIRNGTAYVNVHSTAFPGGEIRAQLEHGDDD
jgi:hypothetical protein